MALSKVTYVDGVTIIGAQNLNDIQDELIRQGEQQTADEAELALKANTADVNTALALKADKNETYTKSEVDSALAAKANTADVNASLELKADKNETYTKTEVNSALALKADKSDTYTKAQVDASLALKADKSDTYTNTEVNTALALKADKSTTYTKTEVDSAVALKANTSDVNAALALKADKSDTYTKTEVDNALALKADAGDVYTKTEADALLDNKANIDGSYDGMTVGNAEQLLSDEYVEDKVPYHFRASGGDGTDREFDMLVGGTVAFNQLVQNDSASVTVPSGHKFYSNINSVKTIGASTGTAISINDGSKDNVIDLTQMFGSTIADYIYTLETNNAGAGVAWFKSLFPNNYYVYNEGELKSVEGVSAHTMVGFNQFDKNSVIYYGYLTNQNSQDIWKQSNDSRSFAIKCLPNTTYCVYYKDFSSAVMRVGSTSAEGLPSTPTSGGWIVPLEKAYSQVQSGSDKIVYTTGENAKWLIVQLGSVLVPTGLGNLCVSFSSEKNGTYEPYVKHSYPLDDSLTLRGIPKLDASNQLYYDGDTYEHDGTVTRKYGIVDMGTLSWTYEGAYNFFYTQISNKANGTNFICAKYTNVGIQTDSQMGSASSGIIATSSATSKYICIKDTAYTNATAFKNSLSGVYLVYELATPTTETAEPFTNPQILSPYGTEEYVITGIVPVGHDTKYPSNLRKKIEGLPWNFSNIIAPTEVTNKATRNYAIGDYLILDNTLYKVTSAIANGGTITVGTNVSATTIMAEIQALA